MNYQEHETVEDQSSRPEDIIKVLFVIFGFKVSCVCILLVLSHWMVCFLFAG